MILCIFCINWGDLRVQHIKEKKKRGYQETTLLNIRCRVNISPHWVSLTVVTVLIILMNVLKFELNDKTLHMKTDSETAFITQYIFHDIMFSDIDV